jgi:CubicO group peptidase (beta-lactamase class C family)
MDDTGFTVPADKWSRFATAYIPDGHGGLRPIKDPERLEKSTLSPLAYYREPKRYFSGGAGLVSTVDDYARFCEMLLSGGSFRGTRILGPATVELMTAPHTRDLPFGSVDPGYDFGLGFAVVTDLGGTGIPGSVGAYGWGGAYATAFFVDPKERIVGIVMTQRFSPDDDLPLSDAFATSVYEALVR